MPQFYTATNSNYYTFCNSTATTTNYIPAWPNWQPSTTCSNSTIIQNNNWYYPQNWEPTSPYRATVTSLTYTQSQDQIWQHWVNQPVVNQPVYMRSGELEAQREAYARQEQERAAARIRARILLGEFLSDEQKTELEHHGRFHITGSRGRRYCIRAEGQAGNVDLLKPDGSVQARLCCHPRDHLPEGDAWLMQMIEIRHDEDHFLRTANVHRGSLPVAA